MISGITIIPQNKSINLHYHNCEEAVMILEGTAIAEINKKKYILKKEKLAGYQLKFHIVS